MLGSARSAPAKAMSSISRLHAAESKRDGASSCWVIRLGLTATNRLAQESEPGTEPSPITFRRRPPCSTRELKAWLSRSVHLRCSGNSLSIALRAALSGPLDSVLLRATTAATERCRTKDEPQSRCEAPSCGRLRPAIRLGALPPRPALTNARREPLRCAAPLCHSSTMQRTVPRHNSSNRTL